MTKHDFEQTVIGFGYEKLETFETEFRDLFIHPEEPGLLPMIITRMDGTVGLEFTARDREPSHNNFSRSEALLLLLAFLEELTDDRDCRNEDDESRV